MYDVASSLSVSLSALTLALGYCPLDTITLTAEAYNILERQVANETGREFPMIENIRIGDKYVTIRCAEPATSFDS